MRREPEELVEVGAISGALNIPLGIVKVFHLRKIMFKVSSQI
jgi:hypothetical protein